MRLGKRRQATVSLLVIVAVSVGVFIAAAFTDTTDVAGEPTLNINRFTIGGGGDMLSVGGGLELSGTIGQPDAGSMLIGGDFTLTGGFWFETPVGDCNSTGGVNLLDYDDFESCLSGPEGGLPADNCNCFDIDHDNDVDLSDVAEFQQSFTDG